MSSRKVLDSYALIAFLENEPGAEKVAAAFKQARDSEKPIYMSVVNWGEVFYIIHREVGPEAAQKVLQSIDTLPIEVIDADKEITLIAAGFKSSKKMSYADCFAAALAKLKKADLMTGDREFKEVEGKVKISWLT